LDARCRAFNDLQQYERGLADCKASIALQPRYSYAHLNLGTSLVGLGDLPNGIAEFTKAIELKPNVIHSYLGRARALAALGNKELAKEDFRQALTIDPTSQQAREGMAALDNPPATAANELQPTPAPPTQPTGATTEAPILRSLPSDVQRQIEEVRQSCPPSDEYVTKGDEGLRTFTVSGAQAVLVDELNFCGWGLRCLHGVNCATGFTHSVAIYVRYGKAWRKSFSVDATEHIFLSIEPYSDTFRALVLSVHAGWDLGCPVRNKNDPTAWKREKCDFVVKWDGSRFVHKPL
jgi:tetratricopeptide (TPR) repeat protein